MDKINPRDKSFFNIGGTILLEYKKKASAILTYNNYSRLAPLQTLLYKSHTLKFDIFGNYNLYRTDKKLDDLKITRYGVPKLIKKGNFLNSKINSLNLVVENLLNEKKPLVSLEKSIKIFKILVAALISNKNRKTIYYQNINQIIKKEKFDNRDLKFT